MVTNKVLLLIFMLFIHIKVDVGRKSNGEKTNIQLVWRKYEHGTANEKDLVWGRFLLISRAFTWSVMIHIPTFIYRFLCSMNIGVWILLSIIINTILYSAIEERMNIAHKRINSINSQWAHMLQILITYVALVL